MGLGSLFAFVVTHRDHGCPHRHWMRSDGTMGRAFSVDGPLPPDLRPGQRAIRVVSASAVGSPRPEV